MDDERYRRRDPGTSESIAEAGAAPSATKSKRTRGQKRSKVQNDKPSRARADSKQAQLIAMLKTAKGASINEVVGAFGWQAHTVRGTIAGALKKKLGLAVISEKVEGRGRVYQIVN